MKDFDNDCARDIAIMISNGNVYRSEKYFYHCVLAYSVGVDAKDVIDTKAHGRWRGCGCLEDVNKFIKYHRERDGIETKEEFLEFFKGRM